MCVALGGRLAEEIINGRDNVTTGGPGVGPGRLGNGRGPAVLIVTLMGCALTVAG